MILRFGEATSGPRPMRRPGVPVLLTRPTRFAALTRPGALAVIAALAGFLLLALLATPDLALADPVLHAALLDHLRHGGDFHTAAADTLRAAGLSRSALVPLPTLAVAQAALHPVVVASLFYALAIATLLAWADRIAEACDRRLARLLAGALLIAGIIATARPALVAVPAAWAALLVAWSLALHRPGRWIESASLAAAAALVGEAALAYIAIMALFALRDRRRAEFAGWLAALALPALALLAHRLAVARLVSPDFAPPGGQAATEGLTGPALASAPLAATFFVVALLGWAAWRGALAARVLATLLALATVAVLFDRPGAGLLCLPLLALGLAAVPDAVRDLVRAARDTRRITVTRLAR